MNAASTLVVVLLNGEAVCALPDGEVSEVLAYLRRRAGVVELVRRSADVAQAMVDETCAAQAARIEAADKLATEASNEFWTWGGTPLRSALLQRARALRSL